MEKLLQVGECAPEVFAASARLLSNPNIVSIE